MDSGGRGGTPRERNAASSAAGGEWRGGEREAGAPSPLCSAWGAGRYLACRAPPFRSRWWWCCPAAGVSRPAAPAHTSSSGSPPAARTVPPAGGASAGTPALPRGRTESPDGEGGGGGGGRGRPTRTGNGSAPSWMTNPSITCVRIWGFTMAWGGLFSPLCGAAPATVEAELPFPEVMPGALASGCA